MRRSLIACVILLAGGAIMLSLIYTYAGNTHPRYMPRVAIISAFSAETAPLRERLLNPQTVTLDGWIYHTGTLNGREVVIFSVGESMVNAAMNTQRLLENWHITQVIVTGIAGGVAPGAGLGAVYIPAQWAHHQESIYALTQGDGFSLPDHFTETVAPFEMMHPKPVRVRPPQQPETTIARFWFPADADLLVLAGELEGVNMGGAGVSGQAYVANADYGAYLQKAFDAVVVDMESSAVAQVAWVNNVPFIAVRAVSDRAGDSYTVIEAHYRTAIEAACEAVWQLLGRMAG